MADPVQEAADRLYGLPLEDFVRERDATAKALRREKARDEAKEVGALAKPSAAAWAVNAIAREQPDLRDELLAAGDAVRAAQEEAVAGKGAKALRDATTRQRHAIDAVIAAAADLEPGGKPLSRTALDRLRQTLQAAAGDDEVRTAIEQGRLIRDAAGGGAWPFGGDDDDEPAKPRQGRATKRAGGAARGATKRAGAGGDDAGGEDAEAKAREREERERERREAAERRRAIEAELAEARAERRGRERDLTRAERDAERAVKRLDEAQAALDEAREHAEEAAAELDSAREAAETARDHAARLEEQLD